MTGKFDEFLVDSDDDSEHLLNASASISTHNQSNFVKTRVEEEESQGGPETLVNSLSETNRQRMMSTSSSIHPNNPSSEQDQKSNKSLVNRQKDNHSNGVLPDTIYMGPNGSTKPSLIIEGSPAARKSDASSTAVRESLATSLSPQPSRLPPPRLSSRAAQVAKKRGETNDFPQSGSVEIPQRFFCKPPPPRSPFAPREPAMPPTSQLKESPFVLVKSPAGRRELHTTLFPQAMSDGSTQWVLRQGEAENSPRMIVRPPPVKCSHRAEEYMKSKQKALTEDAQRREATAALLQDSRVPILYPKLSYYLPIKEAENSSSPWNMHGYNRYHRCKRMLAELNDQKKISREDVEKLVRTLQPIQVARVRDGENGSKEEGSVTESLPCDCIAHDGCDVGSGLRKDVLASKSMLLAKDDEEYGEKCRRYLNLLPVPLARADIPELRADGGATLSSLLQDRGEQQMQDGQNGLEMAQNISLANEFQNTSRAFATLGGIWCTVDGLREDGRPVTPRDVKPPRRVMRICGGHSIGEPLPLERPQQPTKFFPVRCYELLFFPQESVSPDAVNYGAEGITLGQMVAPPASSVPLTPRIVINQDGMLYEYRKKLYQSKSPPVVSQNQHDDYLTFSSSSSSPIGGDNSGNSSSTNYCYVTHTIVSVSEEIRFSIELNVVLLPFVSVVEEGGKYLVEVPRFCPATAVQNRKIQSLYISFSTQQAFIAAYKALLWATECNVLDINFLDSVADEGSKGYATLRLAATLSPLGSWTSCIDSRVPSTDVFTGALPNASKQDNKQQEYQCGKGVYQTKCLDFMVLNLLQSQKDSDATPLSLSDFIFEEKKGEKVIQKNAIFHDTLPTSKEELERFIDPKLATVVAYTPFGVVRRAVSRRTNDVFDVRVIPRGAMKLLPLYTNHIDISYRSFSQTHQDDRSESERNELRNCEQLDRDVEAAIFLEYISHLPALSPVRAVILDKKNYYIFQEPWISALAMEKRHRSIAGPSVHMAHNPNLKHIADNTVMMTLKDFIHGILHRHTHPIQQHQKGVNQFKPKSLTVDDMEPKFQLEQLLIAELLLLLVSIHGKGILLGPCPPQRVLVRIKTSLLDDEIVEDESGERRQSDRQAITSQHIQLFISDLGINTKAWKYERQQCGVLEYLSPFYLLEAMKNTKFGVDDAYWTVYDDWWTFLCLTFEILALDGSSLLMPSKRNTSTSSPTPLISTFTSPEEILCVWKKVMTSGGKQELSDTIRELVHQRVLDSVSPKIESWIASKAEELELFGTTGPRAAPSAVCGELELGTTLSSENCFGVSLSTLYGKRRSPSSRSCSPPREPGEPPVAHAENVLKKVPFLFYYRELFDSILDILLSETCGRFVCAIHSPALYLFSHPFFKSISPASVFDGSWKLPRSCQSFFFHYLRKSRAEQAVYQYRREVFEHHPLTRLSEAPLLLTASNYRRSPFGGGEPLLLVAGGGQETSFSSAEQFNTSSLNGNNDTSSNEHSVKYKKVKSLYNVSESEEIVESDEQVRRALSSQHQESPQQKLVELKNISSGTADEIEVKASSEVRKPPEVAELRTDDRMNRRPDTETDLFDEAYSGKPNIQSKEIAAKTDGIKSTFSYDSSNNFAPPSSSAPPLPSPSHSLSSSYTSTASGSVTSSLETAAKERHQNPYAFVSAQNKTPSNPLPHPYPFDSGCQKRFQNPVTSVPPSATTTTTLPLSNYDSPFSRCATITDPVTPTLYQRSSFPSPLSHSHVMNTPSIRTFHEIEHALNHLGAPSQTSTCLSSAQSAVWPNEFENNSELYSQNPSLYSSDSQKRERRSRHHKGRTEYVSGSRKAYDYYNHE